MVPQSAVDDSAFSLLVTRFSNKIFCNTQNTGKYFSFTVFRLTIFKPCAFILAASHLVSCCLLFGKPEHWKVSPGNAEMLFQRKHSLSLQQSAAWQQIKKIILAANLRKHVLIKIAVTLENHALWFIATSMAQSSRSASCCLIISSFFNCLQYA